MSNVMKVLRITNLSYCLKIVILLNELIQKYQLLIYNYRNPLYWDTCIKIQVTWK